MKDIFGQQTTKVKQLADFISQKISMGTYKIEDALPSINQLSRSHHVSRDTVYKAFAELKERGLIESSPGKSHYVVNRQKKVLLLLDEYSPFKDTFYNNFFKHLSPDWKIDLWFHQYNENLFNLIVCESIGKYNKYIIMNFDNERFSPHLHKIDSAKLLLLDFGKFEKEAYSYICQDFDEAFYKGMTQLGKELKHYQKLILVLDNTSKHPQSTTEYFLRYCDDHGLQGEVNTNADELSVRKGEAYIAIRQMDVVNIIKKSREKELTCGADFGLIAYNDTPAYEVIDRGITTLSIDWEEMGKMAAEFVLTGNQMQTYLPTEVHKRGSV